MTKKETILNAARSCYLRLGVAKTGVADIAADCGLSRATIYRCFRSVDDILLEVMICESKLMCEDAVDILSQFENPLDRAVEGILFCLEEVPRRPLYKHFFQSEAVNWVTGKTLPSQRIHDLCVSELQRSIGFTAIDAEHLALLSRELDWLAESILRLLMSYVMVPSSIARNRDDMRELLRTVLKPAIRDLILKFDRSSINNQLEK